MFWKHSAQTLMIKLHNAVRLTKSGEVKRMLDLGADPKTMHINAERRPYHGNALHAHASIRHSNYVDADYEIVAMLLNHGVHINSQNDEGDTPLHLAARIPNKYQSSVDCIQHLLDLGADPHITNKDGRTALHELCTESGNPKISKEIARMLINKGGAKIDARDKDGRTPLMLAAMCGSWPLCDALEQMGADILLKDNDGHSPAMQATMALHDTLGQFLHFRERAAQKARQAAAMPGEETKSTWQKLSDSSIAHISNEKALGYKITEIFNFEARTYTCMSSNLVTKAEAITVKTFDDFNDRKAIVTAHRELVHMGGKADADSIQTRILDKPVKRRTGSDHGPQGF